MSDSKPNETLGELLRAGREGTPHIYNQYELAEAVGVSQSTISAWETGRSAPSDAQLEKIATALSLPLEELRAARDRSVSSTSSTAPEKSNSRDEILDEAAERILQGAIRGEYSSVLEAANDMGIHPTAAETAVRLLEHFGAIRMSGGKMVATETGIEMSRQRGLFDRSPAKTEPSRFEVLLWDDSESKRIDLLTDALATLKKWAVVSFAVNSARRVLRLLRIGYAVSASQRDVLLAAVEYADRCAQAGIVLEDTDGVVRSAIEARDEIQRRAARHINRSTRARAEYDDDAASFHQGEFASDAETVEIADIAIAAAMSPSTSEVQAVRQIAKAVACFYVRPSSRVPGERHYTHLSDDLKILAIESDRPDATGKPAPNEEAKTADGGRITETTFRFRRRASDDEQCLSIPLYLHTLQTVLDGTDDEACIAIFGHWGRGKTYLAEELGKRITRNGGVTISFSAWQYPSTPELWVHLYETFAEGARGFGLFSRVAVAVRTALYRDGVWPLLLILFVLSTVITPLWQRLEIARDWLPAIGLVGGFMLLKIYLSFGKTFRQLARQYFVLPSHSSRLGLQAAIGHDLESLLRGWVLATQPTVRKLFRLFWLNGGTVVLYVTATILIYWTLRPYEGTNHIVNVWLIGPVYEYIPKVVSEHLQAIWMVVAFGIPLWVAFFGWQRRRLFLIVDDLDRCHPDQMLTVIESLKLMMEKREVNSRLQVLLLVEEGILKDAVLNRYKRLLPRRSRADVDHGDTDELLQYTRERLWRETLEKLFVAHLRLPPLTSAEIVDAMKFFTGATTGVKTDAEISPKKAGIDPDEKNLALTSPSVADPNALKVDITGPNQQAETRELRQDAAKVRSPATLSEADRSALLLAAEHLATHKGEIPVGPRMERNFICRYLIAKVMLLHLGSSASPTSIVASLLEAAGYPAENGKLAEVAKDEMIMEVAKQLS